MADELPSNSRKNPLSMGAFLAGVLSFLVFFGGGFIFDLWPMGSLIGAGAVVLGFMARRRESTGRGLATAGLVLGGIVLAWLVVYIVLVATGVVTA